MDGLGSPADIAARIHELQPGLAPRFAVEELCRQLDIDSIVEVTTDAYEAALLMHPEKAVGSILVAKGRSDQRRHFSIGHELGHFLIPTRLPRPGEPFECSLTDLHLVDTREKDRRRRIEAEANRFAAALLMPKREVRKAMASHRPDLKEIKRLAREFGVSKEAMARSYIEAQHGAIAVLILDRGRLARVYRHSDLPWIETSVGQPVPADPFASGHHLQPGEMSDIEECDPELWFNQRGAARINVLTVQLLGQANGFAMLLLHAEMIQPSCFCLSLRPKAILLRSYSCTVDAGCENQRGRKC